MRSKLIMLIILITFLFNSVYSQFNQEKFLFRAKTIYHSLRVKGLENFTSWVTSDLFLEATKETYKEEIYPLELIWKNPNMFYYIKRALPVQKEGEQNSQAQELQMNMVQTLKGLLIDWQRFCAGNILDDLPETYLITTVADTAFIQYENYDDGKLIKVKMIFGLNGICLKLKVELPDKNEVIVTYPGFKLMGEKWLCTGWTVQTLRNGSVESGFMVKLRSREIDNYWIPERLNLQLQKKGTDNTRYTRTFIFKNILLNKELNFQP